MTAAAPSRKERRAQRRRNASRVMAPEGIELNLPIAGIGARLGAQITDVLLTSTFALSLFLIIFFSELVDPWSLSAVAVLLFFIIRIPYYIVTELIWNGQTLGKRFVKIRVVAHRGGPLTTHALVMRNILKEAEVFLPGTLLLTLDSDAPYGSLISMAWVMMAFAIPLSNPHRMRLGDFAAGTHVVALQDPILLSDLAKSSSAKTTSTTKFTFQAYQLDHYGRFELQTLESFLRAQERDMDQAQYKRSAETLAAIVERVRKKIGYADAVKRADHLAFLSAFYKAQRAYLEQRQIFGDRRTDKFHRDETGS